MLSADILQDSVLERLRVNADARGARLFYHAELFLRDGVGASCFDRIFSCGGHVEAAADGIRNGF